MTGRCSSLDELIDAAASESFDTMKKLLLYLRNEKLRRSDLVVRYGEILLKFDTRLGHQIWDLYEQVFLAAIDVKDVGLAERLMTKLNHQFPESQRVKRLKAMKLEQAGDFVGATTIYKAMLEENPANVLVWKRQVSIMKAQDKFDDAIFKLNDVIRHFPTDLSAWLELAETYMFRGCYRQAAFCLEELILVNPSDFTYHLRLAEIYITSGGIENMICARKHFCKSIDLNRKKNLRAWCGLFLCSKMLIRQKSVIAELKEFELTKRLLRASSTFVCGQYAVEASNGVNEIASRALSISH